MKIFTKRSFILSLLFFFTFNTQAQEFKWAKRAGLWAYDYGYGISADDSGNVYVAGKYEMDAIFDDSTVTCEGNHDIFITKYGPGGNLIWVNTAGGLWGDYAHAIACDGAGNSYITGEIEATSIFHGSNITLNAWGKNDIFVAKYNSDGVPQWAHRGGGKISDKGQSIAISQDAVYVTGYFRDTALFNNNGAFKVISAGEKDAFFAKYDLMGNLIWLKRGGGIGDDEGSGITVGEDGFIYAAGHFDGAGNFDGVAVNSNGGRDAYLAKFNPSGNLIWIKNEGGSGRETGMAVKAAKDGRIYMTGGFSGKVKFGSISISSKGDHDIFVSCFTNNGGVVWAKRAGGTLSDVGLGIAADDSSIYITGHYGGSADFEGQSITGIDSAEIFIAKYDYNGEFKWVMKADGQKDAKYESQHEEAGRSIWVDRKKFVFVTGSYGTDASLGPFDLQGWSNTDIFVAKIKQDESEEIDNTGILENKPDNHFKVYPIPSDGAINVAYSGTEHLNVNIKLQSIEGKTIVEKVYRYSGSNNEVIRLDNIARGIYFLQIQTEHERIVRKIIINKL